MCGIYNFKTPHSLRSTVSLRFRCHTTLTLFPHILSAGWRWQSDTSLAHAASTAMTSSSLSTTSRRYTFIGFPPFVLTPKGRADLSPKGTRRLTFSAALATADRCTSVRASIRSAPGAGDCSFSLTYTPTRHRTRYVPSVSLRRPVCEPLTLSRKLLPTSRSDTSLCSNFSCAVCSIRSPLRA